jgi:nucleoside-diphosphate-sugar epimerase
MKDAAAQKDAAVQPSVLITGGTGLTGSAVVEAMTGMRVVSLSRHGAAGWTQHAARRHTSAASLLPGAHGHVVPAAEERGEVAHVVGDVTQPLLGLSEEGYQQLARSVDVVLHAAGVSDYTTPWHTTHEVNVEGTRNVIAFADRAGLPLYHLSTGYVQAQGGTLNGRWGAGAYFNSKREAELLLERSSTLHAVIRPSIVFGDSRSGWSPSFQGLHRVVGLMLEDRLALLPFGPEVRADFLPRDVVGRTVAELVRSGFRGEYWLTAGSAAPSFGRIVELLMDYGRTAGLELNPPRFVSQEMIERLLKPAGGAALARRIDLLSALTSHFSSSPELPSSLPDHLKGDLEDVLIKGVAHWRLLRATAPEPAAVRA